MIAFVKGEIAALEESSVIIETQGIGYRIFVPASTVAERLHIGEEVKLHTFLHVKEDAMQLYGFLNTQDLQLFKLLLGVNGVGPKAALGILSALSADTLRFAILSEDTMTICRAPGIGKKTAQKLILELKDKMDLAEAFEQKLSHTAEHQQEAANLTLSSEAVEALVALGYSSTEALRAVHAAEDESIQDVESLLKAALKKM